MLRNSARFTARHIGFANHVEQRRLAVVNVAHDRNHRSARLQIRRFFHDFDVSHRFGFEADCTGRSAKFARQIRRQLRIQRLVDRCEHAAIHQFLDHEIRLHVQFLGKLLHRNAFGNRNVAVDRRRSGRLFTPHRPQNLLAILCLTRTPSLRTGSRLVICAWTPLLLVRHRRRSTRSHQPARCARSRMHPRAHPRTRCSRSTRSARTHRPPALHRLSLARTPGPLINRSTGGRTCRRTHRRTRPRRRRWCGKCGILRARLGKPCRQIRSRRHHRTLRRLPH